MSPKKRPDQEAADSRPEAQPESQNTSHMTLKNALRYAAVAVCAILVVSAVTIIPQINFSKLTPSPGKQTSAVSSAGPAASSSIASAPVVQKTSSTPVFHPILREQWSSKHAFDPEQYTEQSWSRAQILSYIGKGIRPDMPLDLWESERKSWTVYTKKEDGEIAYDFFQFIFAENFDDTYQPDRRKMTIGVSKLGFGGDCLYVIDGQELTSLDGASMLLGRRELDDGCVVMVAYFEADGLKYEVICENLTEGEFLKILRSIA